jgi:hypothetical protein
VTDPSQPGDELGWTCDRCHRWNGRAVAFCGTCGADGSAAPREIPRSTACPVPQFRSTRVTRTAIAIFAVVAVLVAGGVLTLVPGAPGYSVLHPVPRAPVSSAQQAAIGRYYLTKLWLPDGNPQVGCPVDVLGAARFGRRLRVYTVVHCVSASLHCAGGADYTAGLVTDLVGTKVVRAQEDDAVYYSGMIAEGSIYPASVRSTALSDIDNDGPGWLRELAMKTAGCPDGVRY